MLARVGQRLTGIRRFDPDVEPGRLVAQAAADTAAVVRAAEVAAAAVELGRRRHWRYLGQLV